MRIRAGMAYDMQRIPKGIWTPLIIQTDRISVFYDSTLAEKFWHGSFTDVDRWSNIAEIS